MISQDLLTALVAAGFAAIGWFARQIWTALADLRIDIHKIEVDLPLSYVRRDEHGADMTEIKQMLQKIFDRLDQKADK